MTPAVCHFHHLDKTVQTSESTHLTTGRASYSHGAHAAVGLMQLSVIWHVVESHAKKQCSRSDSNLTSFHGRMFHRRRDSVCFSFAGASNENSWRRHLKIITSNETKSASAGCLRLDVDLQSFVRRRGLRKASPVDRIWRINKTWA
jgi:hypothetical protein